MKKKKDTHAASWPPGERKRRKRRSGRFASTNVRRRNVWSLSATLPSSGRRVLEAAAEQRPLLRSTAPHLLLLLLPECVCVCVCVSNTMTPPLSSRPTRASGMWLPLQEAEGTAVPPSLDAPSHTQRSSWTGGERGWVVTWQSHVTLDNIRIYFIILVQQHKRMHNEFQLQLICNSTQKYIVVLFVCIIRNVNSSSRNNSLGWQISYKIKYSTSINSDSVSTQSITTSSRPALFPSWLWPVDLCILLMWYCTWMSNLSYIRCILLTEFMNIWLKNKKCLFKCKEHYYHWLLTVLLL